MHLQVIQDIATPHNNVLLAALKRKNIGLTLWYCQPKPGQYGWSTDFANAVQPANFYSASRLDFSLLKTIFTNPRDKVLLVGWSNPTTKLVVVLLWLTRRPFTFWLDVPNDNAPRSFLKEKMRRLFLFLLKTANCRLFCVGKHTVAYFRRLGLAPQRLINFPFVVQVKEPSAKTKAAIRKQYGVPAKGLLLSCGSRLVDDKGFDIVIDALAGLTVKQRQQLKCVIVGKGPRRDDLHRLTAENKLQNVIIFKDWMEIADFEALIGSSDAFIHPARFDAYGNAMYALPLGVPVLGSTGAGASVDMVEDGRNGYMFNPAKPQHLTALINRLLTKPALLKPLSRHAKTAATKWTPAIAVQKLIGNIY